MRIKGLDGLRGLSALIIFGAHTELPGLAGGEVGIEIFFVLSGFLITGILVSANLKRKLSIKQFYLRRIKRLWPALVLMALMSGLFLILRFGFEIDEYIRYEIIPSIFYFSNWTRIQNNAPLFLGHTWSLAIEAQFYLLWPLLLLILLKLFRKSITFLIISLIFIISFWRAFLLLSGVIPFELSNRFDTRFDSMLIGCLLYFLSQKSRAIIGELWPASVILLILTVIYYSWRSYWPYLGGLTGISVLAMILIAKIISDQDSLLTRFLSWKPLIWLGIISYSFYLWHLPIIALLRADLGKGSFLTALASFILTLFISILSWYLLEKPFLRHPATKAV